MEQNGERFQQKSVSCSSRFGDSSRKMYVTTTSTTKCQYNRGDNNACINFLVYIQVAMVSCVSNLSPLGTTQPVTLQRLLPLKTLSTCILSSSALHSALGLSQKFNISFATRILAELLDSQQQYLQCSFSVMKDQCTESLTLTLREKIEICVPLCPILVARQ